MFRLEYKEETARKSSPISKRVECEDASIGPFAGSWGAAQGSGAREVLQECEADEVLYPPIAPEFTLSRKEFRVDTADWCFLGF